MNESLCRLLASVLQAASAQAACVLQASTRRKRVLSALHEAHYTHALSHRPRRRFCKQRASDGPARAAADNAVEQEPASSWERYPPTTDGQRVLRARLVHGRMGGPLRERYLAYRAATRYILGLPPSSNGLGGCGGLRSGFEVGDFEFHLQAYPSSSPSSPFTRCRVWTVCLLPLPQ